MNARFTSSIRLFLILVFVAQPRLELPPLRGWASHHFEESDLWVEYRSQSKDRWQNRCQRRAGTPLRSPCAARAPCIDGLGRAKLILFRADIHCAEYPSRANLHIHGVMGWLESCCSHPVSPASGATGTNLRFRSSVLFLSGRPRRSSAIDDLCAPK